jgi:hypothetical protein
LYAVVDEESVGCPDQGCYFSFSAAMHFLTHACMPGTLPAHLASQAASDPCFAWRPAIAGVSDASTTIPQAIKARMCFLSNLKRYLICDYSSSLTHASYDSNHGSAPLVNARAFEPDLDCVSVIDVAYDPTRFKHDPSPGLCGVGQTALRYFHAVNENKNVTVIILVNLADGFLVTHGSNTFGSDGAETRKSPTPAQPRSGPTPRPAPGAGNLRTDPSNGASMHDPGHRARERNG